VGDQQNDRPTRTSATGVTRRRFAGWGAGTALAAITYGFARGETLGSDEPAPIGDPHDLAQAIQRMRAATVDFINGKTDAWKAMCSHRDDATLFGGWGGYERGWQQLGPRYDWAADRFAGGEVTFEEIARYASHDLAVTVHVERMRARLAGGDEVVPINLRVTHTYRREDDGWKLVNRHADALVSIQAPESVVDR
jgi:ketosteroid isomerase-like protein